GSFGGRNRWRSIRRRSRTLAPVPARCKKLDRFGRAEIDLSPWSGEAYRFLVIRLTPPWPASPELLRRWSGQNVRTRLRLRETESGPRDKPTDPLPDGPAHRLLLRRP